MKGNVLSPEFVREFSDSLPEGYRDAYDAHTILEQAKVSARRGEAAVAIGFFGPSREGTRGVCVVADDRPGLLASISAAFVLGDMDVVSAEANTRQGRRGLEAVDLFQLRKVLADGRIVAPDDGDLEQLQQRLTRILRGDPAGQDQAERRSGPPVQRTADATVRFLDDGSGSLATLEVETDDRSGLLLVLSRALFNQRVQIVRSEVKTLGDRVLDRFAIVEFDGAPISAGRRLEIQVAVLSAIEPARRTGPPPAESDSL
jgi:[protein-PII] uridylyltransferase